MLPNRDGRNMLPCIRCCYPDFTTALVLPARLPVCRCDVRLRQSHFFLPQAGTQPLPLAADDGGIRPGGAEEKCA